MRLFQSTAILLFASVLAGCASLAPGSKTEKVIERGGVSALLIPPEYRDVYFNPDNAKERHCRAPGPDFSVEASDGVSLGVGSPIPGIGKGKVGFGSGQAALSLGGRSADVLLTRELMYRACELTANIDADNKEAKEIYYRFLQTIERLGKAQTEVGTNSASDSVASSAPKIGNLNIPSNGNTDSGGMGDGAGGMDNGSGGMDNGSGGMGDGSGGMGDGAGGMGDGAGGMGDGSGGMGDGAGGMGDGSGGMGDGSGGMGDGSGGMGDGSDT